MPHTATNAPTRAGRSPGGLAAGLALALIGAACARGKEAQAPGAQPPPDATAPRPTIERLPDTPPAGDRRGFAGRWAGPCSMTIRCGDEPPSVDEQELDLTIAAADGGLVLVRGPCRHELDVRRKGAAVRPAPRCDDELGRLESWTFALRRDDQELATEVVLRSEAGPGMRCTTKMHGVLTRR
jgi:hypothetical protein